MGSVGGAEGGAGAGAHELAVALAIFPKPWFHAVTGGLEPRAGRARDCAGGSRFLACPTEACEGGWYPLPKSSVLMPSANASRKGQEKPREIVDAAEVGFLLPPPLGRGVR